MTSELPPDEWPDQTAERRSEPSAYYPAPAPEGYTAPSPYPAPAEPAGSPFDSDPDSNRAPIVAGVITALAVLALLAIYIFSTRPEPVAAPPDTTRRVTITTLAPTTTVQAGAEPGYTPIFQEARCRFDLVTNVDYDCGWLLVPEDRQNPDNGRQVRIHVARFESANPDAPPDPILYLDGGPGGSTLAPLQLTFGQAWQPLLDDRDLILFDQRGVGFSTPSLDCPEEREWAFSVLDQDLSPAEERAAELQAIQQCRDRLIANGVDLAQYNSAENAADVADLRLALGLEEVNLLGISYGTRLAETVMRDHPTGIRSVVLDSTYSPDVNLISEGPANFDRALAKLWEGCRLDTDCSDYYNDLEARFYAIVDQFDTAPITASVRDFLNGGSWQVLFDGDWILGTVFQGLYSDQVISLLPQLIEELEQGDTSTLTLLTSNTLANAEFLSLGMHLSVQCHEEVPFTTADELARGLAGFEHIAESFDGASNLGDFMFEACDLWQAGIADPEENEPVESPIPTLVLAGEYDPITPPAWGAAAAAYLETATYVEFPGLGHGTSIAGDCPLSVTFSFFADPTTAPDTRCVASMPGVDFEIPGEPAAAIELVPFSEDVLGTTITGVVPDGWESVGFGAYIRGDSAVDQTAILQQVAPVVSPDDLVNLLAQQFEMAGDPERTSTYETEMGTWELYRGAAEGFSVDMAVVDLGRAAAVVVLISDPLERELLLGELMLPALDAFRAE